MIRVKRAAAVALVLVVVLMSAWFLGGAPEGAAPSPVVSPEQAPASESPLPVVPGISVEPDPAGFSPVPSGATAEPEPSFEAEATPGSQSVWSGRTFDGGFTVMLSVRCDTLLARMDSLDEEKRALVPEDGVIYPASEVEIYDGESVFHLLQREMKNAGIHLAFRRTPIYDSAYIEAIHNLYEFDAGELSGWQYLLNGKAPGYGCSQCIPEPGDVIEWFYSCDLGFGSDPTAQPGN